MRKSRFYSTLFMLIAVSVQMLQAVHYVDLEWYQDHTLPPTRRVVTLEDFVREGWDIFKMNTDESVFNEYVITDLFWNTLRHSLKDGTLFNWLAGYQPFERQTGGNLFMSSVYAYINQVPVTYRTVTPDGDSITVSGKLFLPNKKFAKNIIIANHYTVCATSEAPSHASSIEGIFATKDYIVLMPDYIGYGISERLPHPYLHLESTVRTAVDLLQAVLPYLEANEYTYSDSLILIGYSQGGAATLGLQKTLEERYADRYPVKQVYAGAGPYDLTGTFDYYISNTTTDISCSLPMLIIGMDYGEQLGLNREDFFQPVLMERCPDLIDSKRHLMTNVNTALGNDMKTLLKPAIFHPEEYPASVLYEAVRRNCITDWTPRSPLFLFHSTEDNMVPFLNSERMQAELEKRGAERVSYDFAPYDNHMQAAITFFEKVYKALE